MNEIQALYDNLQDQREILSEFALNHDQYTDVFNQIIKHLHTCNTSTLALIDYTISKDNLFDVGTNTSDSCSEASDKDIETLVENLDSNLNLNHDSDNDIKRIQTPDTEKTPKKPIYSKTPTNAEYKPIISNSIHIDQIPLTLNSESESDWTESGIDEEIESKKIEIHTQSLRWVNINDMGYTGSLTDIPDGTVFLLQIKKNELWMHKEIINDDLHIFRVAKDGNLYKVIDGNLVYAKDTNENIRTWIEKSKKSFV